MLQLTKKVSLLVLVVGVTGLGLIIGQNVTRYTIHMGMSYANPPSPAAPQTSQQERYRNLELFQKVLHFVENNYVDEVKNKDLVQGAIKGMLETLDPHSNFLAPDVFKDMKIDTSGKFGGLGIEITVKDNVLTVVSPIEDTPAWKAGLKPGDKIVKINSVSTKGLTLVEAVSKMRGKKGTPVTLSIFRTGFDKIKDVTVYRETIKIRAVPKFDTIEQQYGYVRLSTFNENAAADVAAAIKKLEGKEKLRGLVLDLRMNPGGLLDQAVEVSSLFIDDGIIVSTIGRNKDQKEVKYAKKGSARKDFAMAILVNSSTASAAEIVAGALQDQKRAVVMGQPTFGKGSVQTVIELGDDMGLKLTIARYYTPSGRSIQEKGVQPDIILDQFDPKLLEKARIRQESMREKDLPGHIQNEVKEDFTKEELESMASKKKNPKKESKEGMSDESLEEDEMTPLRMEPKSDYQVREAVNYLKSFEIFKKQGLIEERKPIDHSFLRSRGNAVISNR